MNDDPMNQTNLVNPINQFDPAIITKIKQDLIEPTYYEDIKNSLYGREKWKKIGDISETISKVLTGFATIFAFAAGYFKLTYLSFIAGCLGTSAIVLLQFSSYAVNESRERTARANIILHDLGIKKIVDIEAGLLNTNIETALNNSITNKKLFHPLTHPNDNEFKSIKNNESKISIDHNSKMEINNSDIIDQNELDALLNN